MLGFSKEIKKIIVIKKPKTSQEAFKKKVVVIFSDFLLPLIFKSPLKNLTNSFFCAQHFEYTMNFYIVLAIFCFTCLKKRSWVKTGEGNVVLYYAISAQKYPKIVTQEKENFKESPTGFFKTTFFFFTEF